MHDDPIGGEHLAPVSFSAENHPADLAELLEEMAPEAARVALLALPLGHGAETFGYLPPEIQVALARVLSRGELAAIVTEMNGDDRADLYNRLTPEQQEALLPGLAQAEREDIRRLAAHQEGTAGAIMTSDYATLAPGLTVLQAIGKLRLEAPDKETIYRTYVVDAERRLIGSVRLQTLILAQPQRTVEEVMERTTRAVGVEDDQEEVARSIAKYDIIALPVVDGEGRLVGIVTHDDALDVLQAEATEDFQKVGSVGSMADSIASASIALLYRSRIYWLVLLVFGNLLSGAGLAFFEDTIAAYIVLVFFLPVLIGSGGNAGSQSSTLMVRALATGDVEMKDWGRMFFRELGVAILLGMTMAVAISTIAGFRGGHQVALVVAVSMLLIVTAGSLIGMSMPFILSRFRLDPATASAPLIASIADIMGVVIYFSIARAILLH
ncbi:MAG: magnesium transporter [Geminicoccaceae bacterium]|jgi:magnesium transporter|nr:magnesium transporter [Geminicoccaceae bacterium]MCB9967642.1 magnesium transporter [Geminicoccaceae bacterium]HRY25528.1 magnesium transporter [Geminicoccaceae bacterium]